MDKETKQLIDEKMAELSPLMQSAIKSVDIQSIFRGITSSFNLHIDTANQVYVLVWLVILGLEDTDGLMKGITEIKDLEEETAQKVVEKLNIEILKPIRNYVLSTSEEKRGGEKQIDEKDSEETPADQNTSDKVPAKETPPAPTYGPDPYREDIE